MIEDDAMSLQAEKWDCGRSLRKSFEKENTIKIMKKLSTSKLKGLSSLFSTALLVSMAATSCQPAIESVSLDEHQLTLARGAEGKLTASVLPDSYDPDSVVYWLSSDSTVAIAEDGLVRAIGAGEAIIYALADDKYDSCAVLVNVPVDSVTLNASTARLRPGKELELRASVFPIDATDTLVQWSSSDTAIAVVSHGVVRAKSKGAVTITAEIGGEKVECRITVDAIRRALSEMARLVQNHGGNVESDLRFSIMWNDKSTYNADDLDAHCTEPTGREIFFAMKYGGTGGYLDVDIVGPRYRVKAVENIAWPSLRNLSPGTYVFSVHRYANRGGKTGFRAELEVDGEVYTYDYNGAWDRTIDVSSTSFGVTRTVPTPYVEVARVRVSADGKMSVKHILKPTRR